ncbi:MAG TPA: NmrA/HSCARG family protein [Gemmatimonadales bacterium]|nr:NmrA/HSCARG family protein [Gemmatimonadales bacterium]
MSKKTIVVMGATGAQGGGLARAILADKQGNFAVRAVTRNRDSDKAKALAALGAEIVVADADKEASLENAFHGAYGAFCVTNFWEHFSPEREMKQAEAQARAAGNAGLQHVIWSTLEDVRKFIPLSDTRMPTLHGKYKVPHFDAKGEADDYFRDTGVPTTFLYTSFYWDNFIYFGSGPKPGPDGELLLTMPMGNAPLSGMAAEDIGKCAYGIFKRGDATIDQTIGIAGEHLTGTQLAEKMSRAIGQTVTYNPVTPDVYRGFGFPGADDLGNMFQFYHDFADYFTGRRPIAEAKALNPELLSFDQWLAKYAKQIPLT